MDVLAIIIIIRATSLRSSDPGFPERPTCNMLGESYEPLGSGGHGVDMPE